MGITAYGLFVGRSLNKLYFIRIKNNRRIKTSHHIDIMQACKQFTLYLITSVMLPYLTDCLLCAALRHTSMALALGVHCAGNGVSSVRLQLLTRSMSYKKPCKNKLVAFLIFLQISYSFRFLVVKK